MSEQQTFGEESVQQHQGWKEMEVANPVKTDDGLDTFGPDLSEIRRASDELSQARDSKQREREGRPVDVERFYEHQGGPKSGERIPEREAVTAEQAAFDLTNRRELEANADKVSLEAEIAATIDRIRAGDTAEPQEPVALDLQQPEQPAQPVPEGDEAIAKALEQNPALLHEMQRVIGQEAAKVDLAAQQYAAATYQNAVAAAGALVQAFPELQGLSDPSQIPTAIQVVAKQNPQRAQEMVNHIQGARRLVQEANDARQYQAAQQQQQAQAQFQQAASQHDLAFDKWAAQHASPAEYKAIQEEVWNGFREDGWTTEQISYAWQTNPALRSFAAQRQMFEAAKYRLAQKGVKAKVDRPIPSVVRPGSPMERASDEDISLRELSRPGKTLSPKEAAAFVHARRMRSR